MATFTGLNKWKDALTTGLVRNNPIAFFQNPGFILYVHTPKFAWWNSTETPVRAIKRYQKTGSNMTVSAKANYKAVTVQASTWWFNDAHTNISHDIHTSASNPPAQAVAYTSSNASTSNSQMLFNTLYVPTWVSTTALQNWIINLKSDSYKPSKWLQSRRYATYGSFFNDFHKIRKPTYNNTN